VPQFLWAATAVLGPGGAQPGDLARWHLARFSRGQTIRLRFRIATDAAAGDYGWELDNLSVQGITNTPFSALVPETAVCRAR
jgi:hypothetical protein